MRKAVILLIVILLAAGIGVAVWVQTTASGRAVYNVVDYRVRRLLPNATSSGSGAIAGHITDTDSAPLADALTLVATDRGVVFSDTTDAQGVYQIEGVPAGTYVPLAAKWTYETRRYVEGDVRVSADSVTSGIDFQLAPREPYRPRIDALEIGPPESVTGTFPSDISAVRRRIRFQHAGITHEQALLYEPSGEGKLPALLLTLPTSVWGWEPIGVALANEGYVVVAVGPAEERGLDLAAHTRDVVAVGSLLFGGQLSERVDTSRVGGLAGSFSSVLLFRALRDLPQFRGVVTMGGISDGFLGYNALFSEELEIPAPYDSYVASLGRPDQHPEIYLAASPAFFADHMPPTLIIHTRADEIIPVNQATRFANALERAGTPYELVLYEDTTHYLDPNNPDEETRRVYDVTVRFLDQYVARD